METECLFKLVDFDGIEPSDLTSGFLSMDTKDLIFLTNGTPKNRSLAISTELREIVRHFDELIDGLSYLQNPIYPLTNAVKREFSNGTEVLFINEVVGEPIKAAKTHYLVHEKVIYWKWITCDTLALVTDRNVYHWAVVDELPPLVMLRKHQALSNKSIVNYQSDSSLKWLIIIGKSSEVVDGTVQVCSNYYATDVIFGGSADCITYFGPKRLIIASSNRVDIFELKIVDYAEEGPSIIPRISLVLPGAEYGSPVGVHFSYMYNFIFIIRQHGLLIVFDLSTGTMLGAHLFSNHHILLTSQSLPGGFYAINQEGLVLSVSVNEKNILDYVRHTSPDIARKLARTTDLPGNETEIDDYFKELWNANNFYGAAKYAAVSPRGKLRTNDTVAMLKDAAAVSQQIPLAVYLGELLRRRERLKEFESFEYAHLALQVDEMDTLAERICEFQLECSERIGDLINVRDKELALETYLQGKVSPKVIAALIAQRKYYQILMYYKKVGATSDDYRKVLLTIRDSDVQEALKFSKMLSQMEGGCPFDLSVIDDRFQEKDNS